jgi:hypothetical protein
LALILQLLAIGIAIVCAMRVSILAAVVAYVLALSAEVALAYVSRPFELPVSRHLNAALALLAVIPGVIAALTPGWATGIVLIAATALIVRLVRAWSYRRTGAVTPVWLGLAGLIVEGFTLSYIQKVSFPLGQ